MATSNTKGVRIKDIWFGTMESKFVIWHVYRNRTSRKSSVATLYCSYYGQNYTRSPTTSALHVLCRKWYRANSLLVFSSASVAFRSGFGSSTVFDWIQINRIFNDWLPSEQRHHCKWQPPAKNWTIWIYRINLISQWWIDGRNGILKLAFSECL